MGEVCGEDCQSDPQSKDHHHGLHQRATHHRMAHELGSHKPDRDGMYDCAHDRSGMRHIGHRAQGSKERRMKASIIRDLQALYKELAIRPRIKGICHYADLRWIREEIQELKNGKQDFSFAEKLLDGRYLWSFN